MKLADVDELSTSYFYRLVTGSGRCWSFRLLQVKEGVRFEVASHRVLDKYGCLGHLGVEEFFLHCLSQKNVAGQDCLESERRQPKLCLQKW